MPNNEAVAYERFRCTEIKVSKFKMEKQYNQKIQEYVTKGYAEKIIDVSNMKNRKNLWFLPHFPVFKPRIRD
jgi:hypothetical protein